jgi:D-glycero-alpha-D-manno-heptose-7-phosphate kinase
MASSCTRAGSASIAKPEFSTSRFDSGATIANNSQIDQSVTVRALAPLRLGFAGGGTDLSPYCDEFGGAVLNLTIHRFAYAFIAPRSDQSLEFISSDLEKTESLPLAVQVPTGDGLKLHRGVYNRMVRDFNGGRPIPLTITTFADAPAGSGLGTSSSMVVALVDAFRTLLDLPLGRYDVARLAYEIERIDLGLAGGRQDQYAAAFGGANFIEFLSGDRVIVNPLRVKQGHIDELEASLVTCFTGQSRESARVIAEQSKQMSARSAVAIDAMHQLKADAIQMKHALLTGDINELAQILQRSWIAKKSTAKGVTNDAIDELFNFGLEHGALAGKVSGAGGGGFMMFICTPERRPGFVNALRRKGVQADPVHFTQNGCETWTRRS